MDERVYTIPLGKAYEVPTVKRANRAVSIVREYVARHAKVSEVSISGMLNRYLWRGSRKHPPRNVKIKVIKEGETAKAYLAEEKIEEKKPKEEPKKPEEKAKEAKEPVKKEEKKAEPKKEEPKKEEKPKEEPKKAEKEEKKEAQKEEKK